MPTNLYAGHYTDPPRDGSGQPIPNATFQLYLPGTKTSPTYYTNRLKSGTVSGDPSSDEYGNVDIWPEPGVYEYWFEGRFIQLVTVEEDNEEDDVDLAAAVADLEATLASDYYTAAEVDSAIASGGGPVVGAELQVNKGEPDGYAGLNSSGVVPDDQLPTTATTSTRTPSAHASSHAPGGSDPLVAGPLVGSRVTALKTANYTAAYGEVVLFQPNGTTATTVTLPAPAADKPPITVICVDGGMDEPSLNIATSEGTFTLSPYGDSSPEWQAWAVTFVSSADTHYATVTQAANLFVTDPVSLAGKLIPQQTVTGTSDDLDASLTTYVCTNASPTTLTALKTNPVGFECEVVWGVGAGQPHIVAETDATIVYPDGFEHIRAEGGAVSLKVISNSDGESAVYRAAGDWGEEAAVAAIQLPTVVLGTKSRGSSASSSTCTFSHTVDAGLTNSILIVAVANSGNGSHSHYPTSVTYNGDALTQLVLVENDGSDTHPRFLSLWYRVNPDVGTANVVVTLNSGTSTHICALAATYEHVNQSTPFGTPDTAQSNMTNVVSCDLAGTATTDLMVTAVAARMSYPTQGSGLNYSDNYNASSQSTWIVTATKPGGGDVVGSYSIATENNMCMLAVAMKGAE